MNPEQIDKFLELMERQTAAIEVIAKSTRHQYKITERAAIATEKIATVLANYLKVNMTPEYEYDMVDYLNFDWNSIGAKVIHNDSKNQATVVQWGGYTYKRRSPNNQYGASIFFSRNLGEDDSGKRHYEMFIAFRPAEKLQVEPISYAAQGYLNANQPQK